MGIPKFFRSISERYPLISQLIEQGNIPEFDNLYLDMNGIIHNCSHPNDEDASFRISEADIFLAIFAYIDHLFSKIRPKKLFFLAVDGVAPRAKMNQQRSRRFRTAKEALEIREKALRKGEELPEEEAFDSNCITPGTPFMARLSQQLKYFLAKKVSEDSAWRGVEVVLSGHETPGEGEHKIMEYIRLAKAQPDYSPNVRHCMYGLDADLVMLGLLSHDPHFCLLREEVTFGPQKKKKGSLDTQNFFLLHLSLLREYLDLEFGALRSTLPFPYDLERIIDDFILINIFVGNDFLPHLPGLHINEGALPLLFGIYKRILPAAGGYINEGGVLRVDRLDLILKELQSFERESFIEEFADASWYGAKQTRKNTKTAEIAQANSKKHPVLSQVQRGWFEAVRDFLLAARAAPTSAPRTLFIPTAASAPARDRTFLKNLAGELNLILELDEYDPAADVPAVALTIPSMEDDDELGVDPEVDDAFTIESNKAVDRVLKKYESAKVEAAKKVADDEDEVDPEAEFERQLDDQMVRWKQSYYKGKMGIRYTPDDEDGEMRKLAFRYVEGLQWVLHYYYDGVASWGWFYDYHYAPKISDLRDAASMTFDYKLGKPFRPFDQLMGVLPALSSKHIPEAFRSLMTDPESPIIGFYPTSFEADLNGKKQDWEAVVKIPFIDEDRLLTALDKRAPLLTADEKARNTHGPSSRFTYDANNVYYLASPLPGVFPDLVQSHALIEDYDLPVLSGLHFVKGLCEGVSLGADALAGFPSIKTLPNVARFGHHGVNVFQSESRSESVILTIQNRFEDSKPESVAERTVGKRTFYGWPFLREGLVTAASDGMFRYELAEVGGRQRIVANPIQGSSASQWRQRAERMEHHYSKRFAVLIGNVEMILHIRPLKGLKRMEDSSLVKDYDDVDDHEVTQALQCSVMEVADEDARFVERPAVDIRTEFPEGSPVFFLGQVGYGAPTTIKSAKSADGTDSLAVELTVYSAAAAETKRIAEMAAEAKVERYLPSHAVSRACNLSGLALSKITSSFLLDEGGGKRINVGLNLKFEAKGLKVLGYSRKTAAGWEFSERAVELIKEYNTTFPQIANALQSSPKTDFRSKDQIFFDPRTGVDTTGEFNKLRQWLKTKGVRDFEAVPLYAEALSSDTITRLEAWTAVRAQIRAATAAVAQAKDRGVQVDTRASSRAGKMTIKRIVINGLPRTTVLKPSHAPYLLQSQKFALGDRVVSVVDSGNVPLAMHGFVAERASNSIDVVFDTPFIGGGTLNGRCSPHRGATVPFYAVLNLTQPQFAVSSGAAPNVAQNGHSQSTGARANGHTNGRHPASGTARGRGRGRGAAAVATTAAVSSADYRPPNMFDTRGARGRGSAAAPGAPGSVQILRNGSGGRGRGGAKVHESAPFAGVLSGAQRPSEAAAQQQINPHLAALMGGLRLGGRAGASRGRGRGGAASAGTSAASPALSAPSAVAPAPNALPPPSFGASRQPRPPPSHAAPAAASVPTGPKTRGGRGGRGGARGGTRRPVANGNNGGTAAAVSNGSAA